MFLLPPVPGVPVYLAGLFPPHFYLKSFLRSSHFSFLKGGIIIAEQGRRDLGYWGAVIFACFLCFVLKLGAIVMQQKIIGKLEKKKNH